MLILQLTYIVCHQNHYDYSYDMGFVSILLWTISDLIWNLQAKGRCYSKLLVRYCEHCRVRVVAIATLLISLQQCGLCSGSSTFFSRCTSGAANYVSLART